MIIGKLNIYSNGSRSFYPADIRIEKGIITGIGALTPGEDEPYEDGRGAYVVPGLVDVHTHGIAGEDWCQSGSDGFEKMVKAYARAGVTSVMPTLSSAPYKKMVEATDLINRTESQTGADILGVHWEGRYLNPEKKGAHARELITPLEPSELDAEALTRAKRLHISAAYELDGDGGFAQKAGEIGATMGLAHTMATYAEAKRAEERGIRSYTHLFNAMPPLHHRDGGAMAAAFEGDRFAELICDGIHVSPEMVRFAYRNLGIGRLSLISDSLSATGLPDGDYFSSGLPVTVKDGICRTPEGALAGSTITLDMAVRNLMSFCRIPLTEAIIAATETPARQIGAFDECGSLEVGKRANMLFISSPDTLDITRVMVGGRYITYQKTLEE